MNYLHWNHHVQHDLTPPRLTTTDQSARKNDDDKTTTDQMPSEGNVKKRCCVKAAQRDSFTFIKIRCDVSALSKYTVCFHGGLQNDTFLWTWQDLTYLDTLKTKKNLLPRSGKMRHWPLKLKYWRYIGDFGIGERTTECYGIQGLSSETIFLSSKFQNLRISHWRWTFGEYRYRMCDAFKAPLVCFGTLT